ncbi:Gp19/Gp15/Gp42 family protein [Streptomyces sp. NBC_01361]|uniref:Gp19/Gp15/Gp42 family protein n=1 Tax=Streptomyces sp. NBC_01361 TaxID=2903838 RepID=UPI002E3596DA|nr:Gp19/Gp15/Gp42 family protein [Streptomyces sp. NBC_01361]
MGAHSGTAHAQRLQVVWHGRHRSYCSGIPVIANPTPGLVESVSWAGTFADRANLDAWVSAIRSLMDPDRWAAASAALDRVTELDPAPELALWVKAVERLAGRAEAVAYATVDDVGARLGRLLGEDAQQLAAALLDDAEQRIRARVPDLDERVSGDEHDRALVVSVEAAAVVRVLRNPGGYRSETDENYAYTLDARAAAGFLTILDEEWALLGAARGAFTAAPWPDPLRHDPRHLVRYPRGTGPTSRSIANGGRREPARQRQRDHHRLPAGTDRR